MHSRQKIQSRYPFINMTTVENLYGYNLDTGARNRYIIKELWS